MMVSNTEKEYVFDCFQNPQNSVIKKVKEVRTWSWCYVHFLVCRPIELVSKKSVFFHKIRRVGCLKSFTVRGLMQPRVKSINLVQWPVYGMECQVSTPSFNTSPLILKRKRKKMNFAIKIFLYMKKQSHSIVLVDLNEFSPIFQKVQHSHSRHQKTTSNLLEINLKGKLRLNNSWPLEGARSITDNSIVKFQGQPENVSFMLAIFSKIFGFGQNDARGF